MEKLKKMDEREYPTLMRVLFGLDSPTPSSQDPNDLSDELKSLDFIDSTLNDSQRDAVKFALASGEVALIHGPPGVRSQQDVSFMAKLIEWTRPVKHTPSSSSSSSLSSALSGYSSADHRTSQSTT